MVEMDGMKLVQSNAIMQYIAAKYNLYGKDLKERLLYEVFLEHNYVGRIICYEVTIN